MRWRRDGYWITDEARKVDLDVVHTFLHQSYWARGIPRAVVKRSIQNSINFSLYEGKSQVGFARVITDYATFGYLADVFVLGPHRGRGLGKWLMDVLFSHPKLQGFRRWSLVTRDAHSLYRRNGFGALAKPDYFMEKHDPDIYVRGR